MHGYAKPKVFMVGKSLTTPSVEYIYILAQIHLQVIKKSMWVEPDPKIALQNNSAFYSSYVHP